MMDDDRIERLLRRGPPNDPPFEPSGRWLEEGERSSSRAAAARSRYLAMVTGLAAAAVILVIAVVAGPLLQLREQGVGGLVAEIERRGALRVAIDGGPPQTFTSGRGYDGFDLDIAGEVADRLGVRLEVVVVPRESLLAPDSDGGWDVAISSIPAALAPAESSRRTEPYAVVAGAVAVRTDDALGGIEDLASEAVCAVAGSAAEMWLSNGLTAGPGDTIQAMPASVDPHVQTTLGECLAGLADGTWRAVIIDRRSDVAGAGTVRVLDDAPFELALVALLDRDDTRAEPLVVRLNRLFEGMAADGTIADISRRRFAGDDATP
jgi:polar amino acid transport system substrate-binding protein